MSSPNPNQPSSLPPEGFDAHGSHGSDGPATKERKISLGQILAGILLVLVVIFILENNRKVKIRLIVPEVTVPVSVAIVIAAVLGALIAGLMRYRRHHRVSRR